MRPNWDFYALFSLFHHDVFFKDEKLKYNTISLYESLSKKDLELSGLSQTIKKIILTECKGVNDSKISLTLTGGMDSRLILACLLSAGIKPVCFSYGSENSRDVIFARKLANSFGLQFHNAVNYKPDKDWYYRWVIETIVRDDGNSGLHRAHRTAAIAEHTQLYSPEILFTGHMGGEGLRGLSYNNYFASSFFEEVNEKQSSPLNAAAKVLQEYFLKYSDDDIQNILGKISALSWMKNDSQLNKFFFLYDLVGKIHHSQDIRLFESYIPKVIPVFLQKEYLEVLLGSQYNFLRKPAGIKGRLQNPLVHSKLIELIFPELLDFPLSNGYTPREYLKGLWYYIPVKTLRDYRDRWNYSPNFSYGEWFYEFILEHSSEIRNEVWEFYDKRRYMNALLKGKHAKDEGYWRKFSNPVFFDMLLKHKGGKL